MISVVINTLNEEKNIAQAIQSVKWADEIIVCDMQSDDDTAVIAKRMGAKIFLHKRMGYVEPARSFAISKATGDWILILDADEEIPDSLAEKLQEFAREQNTVTTFVEVPRKNLIFNEWVKASGWWPDYLIRFFKKDKVTWSNTIHSKPKTEGQGIRLPDDDKFAIVHHHYEGITQFMERAVRYSEIQAKDLRTEGYKFSWQDLITKPLSEFLSRFFAHRGFEDGLHGLALGLLQAFAILLVYLRVWEMEGFEKKNLKLDDIHQVAKKGGEEITYWFKYGNLSKNPLTNFLQRARNKIS